VTDQWQEYEAELLDKLEKRYRAQGYETQRHVLLEGTTLRADLVATRAGETVLVEVKRSLRRTASQNDPRLSQFADYAAQRGWRFNIVLANEPNAVDEVEVPVREYVLRLLGDARDIDAGSWIAPIAATAAFEAAARYVISRAGGPMPRPSPVAYVQALALRGLISPDDEAVLRQLIEKRNAAAHGLPAQPVPADVVPRAIDIALALITPHAA
jgi:hypothetical protein